MFRNIKHSATQLLQQNQGSYRHLVRTHSFISTGTWLLLFIICYVIQNLTPDGGLSNLGMHSILLTIQVSLILLRLFMAPLWEKGLTFVALEFVRGHRNTPKELNEGFFHLKPTSGSMFIQGLQYFLMYFISGSVTSLVLTLLPLSQTFYSDITKLLLDPSTPLRGRMLIAAGVYSIVFLCILLYLCLRVFYRYRLTGPIILDNENISGTKATFNSRRLMRGHKKALLKLDLSYWWFHFPSLLGLVVPIFVLFITGSEITLSFKQEATLIMIAALTWLMRLMIHYFTKHKVCAVYVLFYEQLKEQHENTVSLNPF